MRALMLLPRMDIRVITWYSPRCPLRYHSLVHRKNNPYFVEIWPICDKYLTYIFDLFLPLYVVPKIGLSTIRLFLIRIYFQMLQPWHWIIFFALFWYRICENAHFIVIYLFSLHWHTAISNITIKQHSRSITSTQQTLKYGVSWSLWGRSWLQFKLSSFSDY